MSKFDISLSILETISRNNEGRLPNAEVLAARAGMSVEEASEVIKSFRRERGLPELVVVERESEPEPEPETSTTPGPEVYEQILMDDPAQAVDEPVDAFVPGTLLPPHAPSVEEVVNVNEPNKPKRSTVEEHFNRIVDSWSLVFAVAVDLVLNGIGFWIMGPDPIMKVGMVCVSVIVVLFSVRAWIKGNKLLWLTFAFIASFMDTSFILLATDVQSQNVGIDVEYERLKGDVEDAETYLTKLQNLQTEKGAGYATQVRDQTATVEIARKALGEYIPKDLGNRQGMSASGVATAIPDAVMSGRWDRWIFLMLFGLTFIGLQATICSATGVKWNETR